MGMTKRFWIRCIIILIICVIITTLVNVYVLGFAIIDGTSMHPTIDTGEIILVNKVVTAYDRFDVVIIELPQMKIIKRIIALPGETVQIVDGYVYINGSRVEDVVDEEIELAGLAAEPILLGGDEYFVLGDNREESADSRYESVGIIKQEQIVGRATVSIAPLKKLK